MREAKAVVPAIRPRVRATWSSTLPILVLAVLVMLPEYVAGPLASDSALYNKVWLEGFDAQFGSGIPYPRWLPDAWDGRGSPTFYFYPPVFFHLASVIRLLSAHSIGVLTAATVASTILLAASGLTMRAWLRHAVPGTQATVAACAYMAAPYHLFDIYLRGALAESCIYAILPVFLIGLRGIGERRAWGVPLTAGSYALLLMAHIPVTLLVSVTIVPVYAGHLLIKARRDAIPVAVRLAAACALGIALAGIYLIPALTLIGHTSTRAMWSEFFSPDIWFFYDYRAWRARRSSRLMLVPILSAGGLLMAVAAGAKAQRMPPPARAEILCWTLVATLCFALIGGFVPFAWRIDLLRKVQFPWRALVILEFAVITALALARPWRSRLFRAGAGLTLAATTLCGAAIARQAARKIAAPPDRPAAITVIDGPEYLPPGFPILTPPNRPTNPQEIKLPTVRAVTAREATILASTRLRAGEWRVASTGTGTIIAPIFFFPHWAVIDAATGDRSFVHPCTRYRLACWRTSGRRNWVITHRAPSVVHTGAALSGAALMLLALYVPVALRRRHRTADKVRP